MKFLPLIISHTILLKSCFLQEIPHKYDPFESYADQDFVFSCFSNRSILDWGGHAATHRRPGTLGEFLS